MAQDADVDTVDAMCASSISELDEDRQWLYPMLEALLHKDFFGQVGAMCYVICVVPAVAICILWGVGGSGIVELLEVVAAATGGGGQSGSVFLAFDGFFGFGEDSC